MPGLGGFVAQAVQARYVDDEQLLLPPHRTVGFNPALQLNDGLLAQSYMKAYACSYAAALGRVRAAVRELRGALSDSGEVYLDGIGTLFQRAGGSYSFTPLEGGIVAPDLYGLDSLLLPPVPAREATPQPREGKAAARSYTLRVNREVVNYFVAAACAVLFYFFLATPVADVTPALPSQQAAVGLPVVAAVQQSAVAPVAQKPILPRVAPAAAACAQSDAAQGQEAPLVSETLRGDYTLVLASSVARGNAEIYAKQLREAGYRSATVYVRGKMVRVVCGYYASEGEAQSDLRRLRGNDSRFSQAWVLSVPKA